MRFSIDRFITDFGGLIDWCTGAIYILLNKVLSKIFIGGQLTVLAKADSSTFTCERSVLYMLRSSKVDKSCQFNATLSRLILFRWMHKYLASKSFDGSDETPSQNKQYIKTASYDSNFFCQLLMDSTALLRKFGITKANTFGALLFSYTISVYLFGLLTFQVHHYYHKFAKDRRIFKILVSCPSFLMSVG